MSVNAVTNSTSSPLTLCNPAQTDVTLTAAPLQCNPLTTHLLTAALAANYNITIQKSLDFVGGGFFEGLYLMDHRL
jgi:hypothetical protein